MPWLIHGCAMTHAMTHTWVCHDSYMGVPWRHLRHVAHVNECLTCACLIQTSVMTLCFFPSCHVGAKNQNHSNVSLAWIPWLIQTSAITLFFFHQVMFALKIILSTVDQVARRCVSVSVCVLFVFWVCVCVCLRRCGIVCEHKTMKEMNSHKKETHSHTK